MDFAVAFFAYGVFVAGVLFVCGVAYRYADLLEAWAKRRLGKSE